MLSRSRYIAIVASLLILSFSALVFFHTTFIIPSLTQALTTRNQTLYPVLVFYLNAKAFIGTFFPLLLLTGIILFRIVIKFISKHYNTIPYILLTGAVIYSLLIAVIILTSFVQNITIMQ